MTASESLEPSEAALPPRQRLAAPGKWPVVGERASRSTGDTRPWTVSVGGLVARPAVLTLEQIAALGYTEFVTDIHCVTRWSRLGARFGGVTLSALLDHCGGSLPCARFVSLIARSDRDHSTSLPLDDAVSLGTFLALTHDGLPLETIHGGPVRTVTPGRYFYKSLKWLERIELLADDRLGFWESTFGYHNGADPWREERFLAPTLTKHEAESLLQTRVWGVRDLRGLRAAGLDLQNLDARGTLLRDAHFENAQLNGANFDGANLSNAHFAGASLVGASFAGTDCEGADFAGADLRGADFTGASLFGTTFDGAQRDG